MRAEHGMIPDSGMTLSFLTGCPAEHHTLVYENVIPNFRCLADHNAGAVVDKHASSYIRTGMYLNTCQHSAEVRDQPPQKEQPPSPQSVGHTMHPDGVQARVTEQYFPHGPGRRVSSEDRPNILFYVPDQAQCTDVSFQLSYNRVRYLHPGKSYSENSPVER